MRVDQCGRLRAEQRKETRIIPRQATIQDLIDMLELTDTSDRVDQITIETEEEQ